MQYRTLGKTGIKVTPYCLGAMMFGGLGNPDHDDCIRIIHKALDSGINTLSLHDALPISNSDPAFAYRSIFGPVYPASKTALNALTVEIGRAHV